MLNNYCQTVFIKKKLISTNKKVIMGIQVPDEDAKHNKMITVIIFLLRYIKMKLKEIKIYLYNITFLTR